MSMDAFTNGTAAPVNITGSDLTTSMEMTATLIGPLTRVALRLGLIRLPENLHHILASVLFFSVIHLVVAPVVSMTFFKDVYGKMGSEARNNWCIHVVSQVNVLILVPLAMWTMVHAPELDQDRIFGWSDNGVGLLLSVACGYFIWDTADAIINYTELGFVVHGLVALCIYMGSFGPFGAFFTVRCLLWEVSTFFLNIHWFLDKTGRTGTLFQMVNGGFLLLSFFFFRIVYGWTYITPQFVVSWLPVKQESPVFLSVVFLGGNVCLQFLNAFWFFKMIQAIRRRFTPKIHLEERRDSAEAV
ncbi:DUF887-domain-containing protein [Cylindrobasidium torrendii FP15055 ss-10]|uniref:DUF887-domain-containing protein n=1 Tax=Cylindrobasidium torrendii FP15055 ss-10 TaxID=1314674 RepID=A0A0D7BHG5_9AGAR|nr:DUF887-domain-containing protein [Cylindrobasidium torrendii FP15055 ss-10]